MDDIFNTSDVDESDDDDGDSSLQERLPTIITTEEYNVEDDTINDNQDEPLEKLLELFEKEKDPHNELNESAAVLNVSGNKLIIKLCPIEL